MSALKMPLFLDVHTVSLFTRDYSLSMLQEPTTVGYHTTNILQCRTTCHKKKQSGIPCHKKHAKVGCHFIKILQCGTACHKKKKRGTPCHKKIRMWDTYHVTENITMEHLRVQYGVFVFTFFCGTYTS